MEYTDEALREMQLFDPKQFELVKSFLEMEKIEEQAVEVKVEDAPVEEVAEEVVEEVVEDTKEEESEEEYGIDYWKKKGEELAPKDDHSGQDKLNADDATDDHKKALKEENESLRKRLEALEEQFKKSTHREEQPEDDYDDVLAYTRENFPELEKRIERSEKLAAVRAKKELEEALAERLRPFEELKSKTEAQIKEDKNRAFEARHFAEVQAAHPDAADYFDSSKLGKAFMAWAQTQPKLIGNAALYPLSSESADVVYVLSQFKKDTGISKKKPALGDMASSVGKSGVRAEVKPSVELLTDFEMRNIDKLLANAAAYSESDYNSLINRYEKTLSSKEK